jgi:hypothetical protein
VDDKKDDVTDKDEVIVRFGDVAPWRLPNNLDKLLKQSVGAVIGNTPDEPTVVADDRVTSPKPASADLAL